MKMTVEFDDGLARAAEAHAAEIGKTLTALSERFVTDYVRESGRSNRTLGLLTKAGRSVPGVDIDNWAALYDLMDAVREVGALGNLIFDAQIVALCQECRVTALLTEDRDFDRFPEFVSSDLHFGSRRAPPLCKRYHMPQDCHRPSTLKVNADF